MVGNNDRIHGYNPIYRAGDGNFASFDLTNGRPGQFKYRQVTIIPPLPEGVFDHQGHIVPQVTLNQVLDSIANDMAALPTLDAVNDFITNNQQHSWLRLVKQYGETINAPMFDMEETKTEDKVGGFFSIVTWNPINICRAPADTLRNNQPGDSIDGKVVDWINNNQGTAGVPVTWIQQLGYLRQAPTDQVQIEAYISECCATLDTQKTTGLGYYAFPWVKNTGIVGQPLEPQI